MAVSFHGICILLFFVGFGISNQICNNTICSFSGQSYTRFICTKYVESCTVTGCANNNDCVDMELLSAADTTTMNCQNSQACNAVKVHCGYHADGKSMDSGRITCVNGGSCSTINMTV